jgi:hypothetical protein
VHIVYDLFFEAILPLDAVVEQLSFTWKIWWAWQKRFNARSRWTEILENELKNHGIFVFGIIDEFSEVYTSECSNGREIVDQMFALGNSSRQVMHWIICGSSEHIRMLVTGKLSPEFRSQFGNFTGRDLNGTKFVPMQIFPFLQLEDFKKLYFFYNHRHGDNHLKEDDVVSANMCQLYVASCGMPGVIADAKSRIESVSNQYTCSSKIMDVQTSTHIQAMMLKSIFVCLQYISFKAVLTELRKQLIFQKYQKSMCCYGLSNV